MRQELERKYKLGFLLHILTYSPFIFITPRWCFVTNDFDSMATSRFKDCSRRDLLIRGSHRRNVAFVVDCVKSQRERKER